MIGLFKQKTPVNILVVFVVGILIKLPIFRNPVAPVAGNRDAPLYREIVSFLHSVSDKQHFLFAIITYLLLFTQAIQLNRLINDNRMMQRATFLPAISYVLITSLMPEWNVFSPLLLINSLVLLIFTGLFRLYHQYTAKTIIFNTGLAVGIAAFLFFPSVILFFWLILGLMVMRTVKLNEWLICFLGVTAPFYFYSAYLLFTDHWSWSRLFSPVSIQMPAPQQSMWLVAATVLLVVPFLAGGYFVQENLRRMLIQVRKNWSLFLTYLLFALFIPFLNNGTSGFENWILITVPFAAFHACAYLYLPQRLLAAVVFWLSLLFVMVYQYYDYAPGW